MVNEGLESCPDERYFLRRNTILLQSKWHSKSINMTNMQNMQNNLLTYGLCSQAARRHQLQSWGCTLATLAGCSEVEMLRWIMK
jgi:hypothetical protein